MLTIFGGIILGLLVGSFLNVVIYRLPVMMEREWRQQCNELLQAEGIRATDTAPADDKSDEPFNLIYPRSRCSSCGAPVKAWQNIPVISWLILGGKCAACNSRISARYPIIELTTGLLSGLVVWQFGISPESLMALVFVWALIALTVIDIDHQILPDSITQPLLWLGIIVSVAKSADTALPYPDLTASVIGAIAGYLSLWTVYWVFKLITGKEGMGYGDFKLLAALGAWLGWQMLPVVILLSALVGAVVGLGLIVFMGRDRQIPMPFGPYLAGAGLIALFRGNELIDAYLGYSGL